MYKRGYVIIMCVSAVDFSLCRIIALDFSSSLDQFLWKSTLISPYLVIDRQTHGKILINVSQTCLYQNNMHNKSNRAAEYGICGKLC